jgi:hypothetical protein
LLFWSVATTIPFAVGLKPTVFRYMTKRDGEFRTFQEPVQTSSPQSPGITWLCCQAMLICTWQQTSLREKVPDRVHTLSFAADNAPQPTVLPAQLVGGSPFFVGFRHIEGPGAESKQFLALVRGLNNCPPAGTDTKINAEGQALRNVHERPPTSFYAFIRHY